MICGLSRGSTLLVFTGVCDILQETPRYNEGHLDPMSRDFSTPPSPPVTVTGGRKRVGTCAGNGPGGIPAADRSDGQGTGRL